MTVPLTGTDLVKYNNVPTTPLDNKLGDRVSLHIVAPDDTIVSTYCDRLPVAPFSTIETIESPTTGLIPSGYKIRVTYERTGADDCKLGVCLMWLEAGE